LKSEVNITQFGLYKMRFLLCRNDKIALELLFVAQIVVKSPQDKKVVFVDLQERPTEAFGRLTKTLCRLRTWNG